MPSRRSQRAKQRSKTREQTRQDFTLKPLTDNQKLALDVYKQNDVVFLTGPAGTGKTFLAMALAMQDVLNKQYTKIILTRPIVEAGESLGHLPGTFNQKVDPYMTPLFDCYHNLCPGHTLRNKMLESAFEVAPLAFMRGRTFSNSVCIFDEAQNATTTQLKLFLTRFGDNSKLIITGDPHQSDLRDRSGLVSVIDRLNDLQGVGIVKFSRDDVVRHSLITSILERLN